MILVKVRAHPEARAERVVLMADGALDVKVRAPAVDGRTNVAVVTAVAAALRLRAREVRLVRGQRSREKLVEIDLASAEELERRLGRIDGLNGQW